MGVTIVAVIATASFVIAALKAFQWYLMCTAAYLYMAGKGYTLPSAEEIEACMRAAGEHIVREIKDHKK